MPAGLLQRYASLAGRTLAASAIQPARFAKHGQKPKKLAALTMPTLLGSETRKRMYTYSIALTAPRGGSD